MHRTIYDQDHEAFRASVREFAERTLKPRHEEMLHAKSIARDIWKEAGSLGILGLPIPAWRDARVTKIWAGTNEIMKELVGRDLGL